MDEREFSDSLEHYQQHLINYVKITNQEENQNIKSININALSNIELSAKLKTLVGSGKALKPLRDLVSQWRGQDYKIAFVVGTEHRAERLESFARTES